MGGFFRKYEVIVVASDEKDIIYTRSNVRKEEVYIYPIKSDKAYAKSLFLSYLNLTKSLKTQPKWYNTLLYNCTTAIYQLANKIQPMPMDYRILASGYSPNYLYDKKAIDNHYPFEQWQQKAHINAKTSAYHHDNPIDSTAFSTLIRQDFPK